MAQLHCLEQPQVKIAETAMVNADALGQTFGDGINMVGERISIQDKLGDLMSWIWWGLRVHGLATFFYHLAKTMWLGFKIYCFQQWSLTLPALAVKFLLDETETVEYLNWNRKQMVPEEELKWSFTCQGVVFLTSLILAVGTGKMYAMKNKRERTRKFWLCLCRSGPNASYWNARESESGSESNTEVQSQGEPSHRPMSDSETDQLVRRQEFILVGLAHWFLVVLRQKMHRQGVPHNFDVGGVRLVNTAMDEGITSTFHLYLENRYQLKLPAGGKTIFDSDYMALELFFLWANEAKRCPLVFLARVLCMFVVGLSGLGSCMGATPPSLPRNYDYYNYYSHNHTYTDNHNQNHKKQKRKEQKKNNYDYYNHNHTDNQNQNQNKKRGKKQKNTNKNTKRKHGRLPMSWPGCMGSTNMCNKAGRVKSVLAMNRE